jgi:hypothetical protein
MTPIGEDAVPRSQDNQVALTRRRKKGNNTASVAGVEDSQIEVEEHFEDEDEMGNGTQILSQTRRSTRLR